MINSMSTRRGFSVQLATSFAASKMAAGAVTTEAISHSAEAIHQEVVFKASPKRVYEALTEAAQFDKVSQLSGVMKSGMLPTGSAKPTEIANEEGGAFSLFGGYITGRNLELLPTQRIVQAWRSGSWEPGAYSIASFRLVEEGPGTKLIFDHTGYPAGSSQSLAKGWRENYWGSLEKYLAT